MRNGINEHREPRKTTHTPDIYESSHSVHKMLFLLKLENRKLYWSFIWIADFARNEPYEPNENACVLGIEVASYGLSYTCNSHGDESTNSCAVYYSFSYKLLQVRAETFVEQQSSFCGHVQPFITQSTHFGMYNFRHMRRRYLKVIKTEKIPVYVNHPLCIMWSNIFRISSTWTTFLWNA